MDYNIPTYRCCPCSAICGLTGWLQKMSSQLDCIEGELSGTQSALYNIYASLATNNPMSVAAEYPTELQDKVLYSTAKVRFLDMLNPSLVVLFKGKIQSSLPVYFRDRSGSVNPDDGYQHIVTVGDINTPAIAQDIVNNFPYPALYVANYIVLNPTQQTLDDFKNGLIT